LRTVEDVKKQQRRAPKIRKFTLIIRVIHSYTQFTVPSRLTCLASVERTVLTVVSPALLVGLSPIMKVPIVLPVSRLSFCKKAAVMVLSSIAFPPSGESSSSRPIFASASALALSVSDGVQILWRHCPDEFRRAVQASQCFLYRGESPSIVGPTILNPKPDLLAPGTYDDPDALAYFAWMERELAGLSSSRSSKRTHDTSKRRTGSPSEIARPSTGHVGTASEEAARQWGVPVSVWPLGDSFSYVWPRNRPLLYPGGSGSLDDLVIDKDLDIALRSGREVLFSTSAADLDLRGPAYLAFPKSLEPELRERLRAIRYGLTR
jgi:hypothetical protein